MQQLYGKTNLAQNRPGRWLFLVGYRQAIKIWMSYGFWDLRLSLTLATVCGKKLSAMK